MSKTGNEKLIEQLMADGCYYMFGNPGTVEQGFLDAMGEYEKFQYITCLQESIAVAMADGYARKTGRPAVVQLHSGVGLGNGIGMIYQAMRGHAPLVILAGEAGVKYDAMDAQMACDLVSMAKPVTKWSGRVTHKDSVLRMVRRAVKLAVTPPAGPVFLALPLDILNEVNTEQVFPACRINMKTMPDTDTVEEVADLLLNAETPLFVIGDGVSASGGCKTVEEMAKLIGARVYGADSSVVNFDRSSCLYQGELGHMFGENSRDKVREADVILIAGTYVFPEVFPCMDSPFRDDATIVHIDLNTYEIAKNHRVDIGIGADIATALSGIYSMMRMLQTKRQKDAAEERIREMRQWRDDRETDRKEEGIFDEFCRILKKKAGENIIIFDEALTASEVLNHHFRCRMPGTFFQTRGGSLGVGIPGAMGIRLAEPKRQVIGFTGDGGSLYTIQALWTAAKYHIGAKFVILCNGGYQLLKNNIDVYWNETHIAPHAYPDCFSLEPGIDYVRLAEAMHVRGRRLDDAGVTEDAVDWLLGDAGPALLEVHMA